MGEPITPTSRWRVRPTPYTPTGQISGNGTWNLLLYIPNITDQTFQGAGYNELNYFAHREICQDLDNQHQPTQMRGNMAAHQLMYDFDSSISLGHRLVHNFEISEPFGTSADMDWVGEQLFHNFGTGWSGNTGGYPLGTKFTLRSKKEVLHRALELARFGWKVRWRYMFRHITAKKLLFDDSADPQPNAPIRVKGVNNLVHQSEYLSDSILAEADANFFDDVNQHQLLNHKSLHEGAYNIKFDITVQIRRIIEQKILHPDIVKMYTWIANYVDRFSAWRDSAMGILRTSKWYVSPRSKRWVHKAHLAYLETIRHFEALHDEAYRFGKIKRSTWRTVYSCFEGLNALVKFNKFNGFMKRETVAYGNIYGVCEDFPHLNPRSLPDISPAA
ncbi:hypothetical protein F4782DRAFT_14611 [Xylaria castorea]|nr:hypothetical protein F4782DRAFT_14611 [Xylaria castorea]